MNMSDYSCGAMELHNGPNGWIFLFDFGVRIP